MRYGVAKCVNGCEPLGSEVGLKTSESFKSRMNMFKNAAETAFETTSRTLVGALYTDLVSTFFF